MQQLSRTADRYPSRVGQITAVPARYATAQSHHERISHLTGQITTPPARYATAQLHRRQISSPPVGNATPPVHRATQQSHHEQISRRHRQPQCESQPSCGNPVARQAVSPMNTSHRQPIFPPRHTAVTPRADTPINEPNHGDTSTSCDTTVARQADTSATLVATASIPTVVRQPSRTASR